MKNILDLKQIMITDFHNELVFAWVNKEEITAATQNIQVIEVDFSTPKPKVKGKEV